MLDIIMLLYEKNRYIYLFFEGKGEREGEKYHCVVTSSTPSTEDLARNPGMCPDWESNL